MQKALYNACKFCFLPLFFILFTTTSLHASSAKKYIKKYSETVKKLSDEYGIPVSVITAISLIESGAGESRNCKLLKNHFGIIGRNSLKKSQGIKSRFKEYKTDEDSFEHFCKVISRKRYYLKLKGNKSYKEWFDAMAKAGYSTTPDVWKYEMMRAVRSNKLDKLDKL